VRRKKVLTETKVAGVTVLARNDRTSRLLGQANQRIKRLNDIIFDIIFCFRSYIYHFDGKIVYVHDCGVVTIVMEIIIIIINKR